ncbi:MAG: acetoacetate--CoA ligase [Archaeoglobaceae archaeon]|nr:acetoacetate--CoA ligase [Archaeoglobaceae archaeon]MDW7989431.1 acetoacetate--CoA ligase [Archaeoglobaceae archaeon]
MDLLWKPSEEIVRDANMSRFIAYVNQKFGTGIRNYRDLYNWSIENIQEFWNALWDFSGVIYSRKFTRVVEDLKKFPGTKWFVGAKLNFAENLLRHKDGTAFIFRNEAGVRRALSYQELREQVGYLSNALREFGIKPGDRICAYMPNIPETCIAMLATTTVGATWSSCGTELGANAVVDRIGQLEPRILFTVDGYLYKGKGYDFTSNVKTVAESVSSLEKVVVFPYMKREPEVSHIPNAELWNDFASENKELKFEQVEANEPVYIMFSSGTTGKPKCMVQSVGGVLLNHLKELILHTDLKKKDVISYITSPSWMMWNWLMSSLATGATIAIYDGNPLFPDWRTMFKFMDEEGITIFGCSASYIYALIAAGAKPKDEFKLKSLKEISQTGSPLSAEGFRWVYENLKRDLWFNSISGGTDINGCFCAGSPTLPVYAGQLQAPALAMKVFAYDENANPVYDQPGELVCEMPSPSMPIYFWKDKDFKKYRETYFDFYAEKGKNVWRHGDYVIFHSKTGGITFLGRSDATLKISGVRIGTAEIYNVVEKLPEIADSLATSQDWKGDQRLILFVKLKPGYKLTEELKTKIKEELRKKASPRHVPSLIIESPDIPYTVNMKKVEIAVRNIIHGKPVTNRGALINPESLDYFEKIAKELQKEI